MQAKFALSIPLLLIVSSISATNSVHAASSLVLDGVGTNAPCEGNCNSQLLSTTKGHDVIILTVECGYTQCPATIASIVDSSGLKFTQRISYSPGDKLWEYYAIAKSPVKSDNITVSFSGGSIHGIQVLAVHGANNQAIFDPDPSLPATVSCPGLVCGSCNPSPTSGTCSASIQTSTTDFVIATTAINDAGRCGELAGGPPGFITIVSTGWMEVDFAITTTPHSSVVFRCSGTDAMAIVLDAVSIHDVSENVEESSP